MGFGLLRTTIGLIVFVIWVLVLLRVILSWVDPRGYNQVSRYVVPLTEPILAPVRRMLPPTGGVDFSPMVVAIGLGFLLRLLGV